MENTLSEYEDMNVLEFKNMVPIKPEFAEQHSKEFQYYIPELVPAIESLNSGWAGSYYDQLDRMQREIDTFKNWDADLLKHFNYTTNSFVHSKISFEQTAEIFNNLLNDGYKKLSDCAYESLIASRKFISVFSQRANKLMKAKLIRDAENKYFWVEPHFKKRGFIAYSNDFVKL